MKFLRRICIPSTTFALFVLAYSHCPVTLGGVPTILSPPEQQTGVIEEVDANLARSAATLCQQKSAFFLLEYRGKLQSFRGQLCYGIAGYNETCMDPKLEWLTPATKIRLLAPGQVPLEFLRGYTLLVRYPRLSPTTFSYPISRVADNCPSITDEN